MPVTRSLPAVILPAMLAASCTGQQSALEPSGPAARDAAHLWWYMAGGSAIILALVIVLLLYAVFRSPEHRWILAPHHLIIGGGVALPVVVLSILLLFSIRTSAASYASLPDDGLTIHVKGHQWWWEVQYVNGDPSESFTTANEIHIPVGEPVELMLTSGDVIHSFWAPRLAGKLDLIPGRTNRLVIEADEPGIFRAQCAEFCGMAHAKMALYVVALSAEEFTEWAEQQRRPAETPEDPVAAAGSELFQANGCVLCHEIRGRAAAGLEGPDLTHFGSRLTLAGGTLSNNRENVALWLARNHEIKPGNRMPSYIALDLETRLFIAAYLESLR